MDNDHMTQDGDHVTDSGDHVTDSGDQVTDSGDQEQYRDDSSDTGQHSLEKRQRMSVDMPLWTLSDKISDSIHARQVREVRDNRRQKLKHFLHRMG